MTPCGPLSVNRRFGGTYRLHFQGYSAILISNHIGRLQRLLYIGPEMDSSAQHTNHFTVVADNQTFVKVVGEFRFSAILVHSKAYVTYVHMWPSVNWPQATKELTYALDFSGEQ
jgi:hypothetical protein